MRDAERHRRHSHAERGNDKLKAFTTLLSGVKLVADKSCLQSYLGLRDQSSVGRISIAHPAYWWMRSAYPRYIIFDFKNTPSFFQSGRALR